MAGLVWNYCILQAPLREKDTEIIMELMRFYWQNL